MESAKARGWRATVLTLLQEVGQHAPVQQRRWDWEGLLPFYLFLIYIAFFFFFPRPQRLLLVLPKTHQAPVSHEWQSSPARGVKEAWPLEGRCWTAPPQRVFHPPGSARGSLPTLRRQPCNDCLHATSNITRQAPWTFFSSCVFHYMIPKLQEYFFVWSILSQEKKYHTRILSRAFLYYISFIGKTYLIWSDLGYAWFRILSSIVPCLRHSIEKS